MSDDGWEDGPATPSSKDVYSLARMVESEAGGTPEIAQRAVAHAALNHAAGRSISDILTHASGAANGSYGPQEQGRYASTAKEPSPAALRIAHDAITGASDDPTGGAVQWDSPQAYDDPGKAHETAWRRAQEGKHIVTLPDVPSHVFRFFAPTTGNGDWQDGPATHGAKPIDPRFVDTQDPETRPFASNTGPDVAGQLHAQAAAQQAPSATEAFLRGAGEQASFGAGPAIEAALSPGDYDTNRKAILARTAAAEAAHPTASTVGSLAGTAATMAVPVGDVAEGANVAAHALQGAKTGATFSALNAAGHGVAAGESPSQIAGDVVNQGAIGAVTGGALGAGIGKLVRGAPERVDDRIIANISRGEAGGAAKKKLADKVADLGTDAIIPQLEKTGLKGAVATGAAASPGKVADKVSSVIDQYSTQRLAPIYDAIDKAGTAPKGLDLKYQLLQLQDKLKAAGELQQSAHVGTYLNFVDKHVDDAQQLSASWIRKARNEIGLGNTFATSEESATPAGIQAKRAIYGAFNNAIEGAGARTPGVDVNALKSANQTVSTLLSVRDAMASRALKDKAGGTGIGTAIMGGGVRMGEAAAVGKAVMGMLATGDVSGLGTLAGELAAAEVGKHVVTKTLPQAVRRADYGLSRLESAARAGSTPARVARGALEYGAARLAAPYVARTASQALLGQDQGTPP